MRTNSPRRTARSWSSARRSAPACPRPASAARSAARRSAALADAHGAPFDPASLTEDYELGLRLHALGRALPSFGMPRGRATPSSPRANISLRRSPPRSRQKARWMTGIALAGWDRLGWRGGLAERWMRLRDRQSVLAALVLAAGLSGAGSLGDLALVRLAGAPAAPSFRPRCRRLIAINSGLLLWRLAMRFGFVARAYGWREGLRSLPRTRYRRNIIAHDGRAPRARPLSAPAPDRPDRLGQDRACLSRTSCPANEAGRPAAALPAARPRRLDRRCASSCLPAGWWATCSAASSPPPLLRAVSIDRPPRAPPAVFSVPRTWTRTMSDRLKQGRRDDASAHARGSAAAASGSRSPP